MKILPVESHLSGHFALAVAWLLAAGCSADGTSGGDGSSGGSALLGGATAAGGGTGLDGSPASGGATGTGGSGELAGATGQGVVVSCDTVVTDGRIVITDPTNYTFSNDMTVGVPTLRGATDLLFDWGGVTTDLFGHTLDPAIDVELVLLTLWRMTPAELEAYLEDDDLPTRQNQGMVNVEPADGTTSAYLMSFGLGGAPLSEEDQATLWSKFDTSAADYAYPPEQYTFMLSVSSSPTIGKESRMLSFFTLDPNSEQTALRLSPASTTVDIDVNLRSAVPIAVPVGTPDLTIDWGLMTVNALGNEFVPVQINEAIIGHYPDLTLAGIEERFLDLESLPGRRWSIEVESGVTMNLGSLLDVSGVAFPGIDSAEGVWLVALRCTENCNNPAPWSITILQPC